MCLEMLYLSWILNSISERTESFLQWCYGFHPYIAWYCFYSLINISFDIFSGSTDLPLMFEVNHIDVESMKKIVVNFEDIRSPTPNTYLGSVIVDKMQNRRNDSFYRCSLDKRFSSVFNRSNNSDFIWENFTVLKPSAKKREAIINWFASWWLNKRERDQRCCSWRDTYSLSFSVREFTSCWIESSSVVTLRCTTLTIYGELWNEQLN